MRKIVVVYSSKYGSTKQYAKWIAEEKGADLIQLNKAKIEILLKYDIIVFGGGVYANQLKFKKFIIKNYNVLKDKKVIIFAVGSSPVTDEAIEKIKKANFNSLDFNNISFYLLRGAFDFNNLSPEDKLIMNIFMLKLKSMEKLDCLYFLYSSMAFLVLDIILSISDVYGNI